VLRELDHQIWNKLTEAMGRTPVELPLQVCLGKVDVVHASGTGLEGGLCGPTPAWIEINPSESNMHTRGALAAGFMGVLQFAEKATCAGTWWWRQATQLWADSYVYPADISSRANLAGHYLNSMQKPLPPVISGPSGPLRDYGAYIFPVFLAHKRPAIIGDIWGKTRDSESLLNAIDGVLTQGGTLAGWRDFALAAWNQAPYNYLKTWDGLTNGVWNYLPLDQRFKLDPANHNHVDSHLIPVEVRHLSVKYEEFTFAPGTRTVTFVNATHFVDHKDTNAYVQAILDINGTKTLVDLTGKPGQAFCLDQQAESLDSMVLIFSNGDVSKDIVTSSSDPHPQAMVVATDAGCKEWHGHISTIRHSGDNGGVTETVRFDFTAQGTLPTKFNDFLNAEYQLTSGHVQWDLSGSNPYGTSGSCTWTGSQAFDPPIGPAGTGIGIFIMGWRVDAASMLAFGDVGWGWISNWAPAGTGSYNCTDPDVGPDSGTQPFSINKLLVPEDTTGTNGSAHVNGLSIKGSSTYTNGSTSTTTWTWDVTSTG
jgi:hypothetical protein